MRLALTAALAAALLVPAAVGAAPPQVAGCQVFPASSVWNKPVGSAPQAQALGARSSRRSAPASTCTRTSARASGTAGRSGSRSRSSAASQPTSFVDFLYDDESDDGPYPIPTDVAIEGGPGADGDRHAIIVERDSCTLYELFNLRPAPWEAGSGAIWDLGSNALRPRGWTSADAAGLPILPGLARYDEVASGAIKHALRFTVERSRRAYIYPARHFASSSTSRNLPPMGLRLRLRSDFRVGGFPYQARVILRALKRYGMIVADNGSSWYISGAPDERWNNDQLHTLHRVKGSDFRVVDTSKLRP